MDAYISYREVIPNNINPEDWNEVKINTGTQSTLQDIKTSEKAGGYSYKNVEHVQNRNRFIYWRTYQDVLELTEVSLDFTLLRNNLRLRFTDSAVLNVSLFEQAKCLTILVVTVSSLHRFVFPFKGIETTPGSGAPTEHQPQSIFYDANGSLNNPNTYHVIDGCGTMPQNLPHTAVSYLCESDQQAYFAVAYQTKLVLHVMNNDTGCTNTHEVKEPHLMPRFLSNLKGALIGRGETLEAAISVSFSCIDDEMYLLALYRNNELRLWSVSTMHNVSTISCAESQSNGGAQGPQNSLLRKIDETKFCIFLSFENGAEFVGISITSCLNDTGSNTLSLVKQYTVLAPQMDLVDFDATNSHIWALWSNAEGEFNVSTIYLGTDMLFKRVSAALEPPPDRYCLEQGVDPRKSYCSYIFHPGRFDRNVIAKALYMFRRMNLRFDIKQLSMSLLKEQVCQAVEDEIENETKDFVVSDEEYFEISTQQWERFYSCCEQYHLKFSEPIGLAVLGAIDGVCIVRRQSFALLRPCEMLEHLMLIGEHTEDVAAFMEPFYQCDHSAAVGFVELMKTIAQLEKLLSEDIKMDLDKKFYQQECPNDVVIKLVSQINDCNVEGITSHWIRQLRQKFQEMPNLRHAVEALHSLLGIAEQDAAGQENPSHIATSRFLNSTGALFGSEIGLSVLTETVNQMATIRYSVCRNLLIILHIVHGDTGLDHRYLGTTAYYLKCYYALVWIAATPISLNSPTNFEASIQRLNRAQLFSGYSRPYINNGRLYSHTTLLHLFLKSKGLFSALSTLFGSNENIEQPSLRQTLMELVRLINQLLWPDSTNHVFLEWLFATCHHVIIQEYVRILFAWCRKNDFSRRFMLAVSLLDCGEPYKAIHLFKQSSEGVLTDSFLLEHVLKNTPLYSKVKETISRNGTLSPEDYKQAMVHYYLKVIQLFEQHSALDYIIMLAQSAMCMLQKDDAQMPMFQSIVFNNHLQLEHYVEAYDFLVDNADTSRRKDCLRQLLITLFQCKRYDLLLRFPYAGLQDEFENIVESRARSLTIEQNDAYDFLYSFHVNKDNMRKAATIMYEQAMRLRGYTDMENSLQKRCSSLLVCINCLHLVDERYRWIARPIIEDDEVANAEHTDEEQEEEDVFIKKQEVVVLELEDIRRELLHAEALLELSNYCKDISSYERASAEELSYLLAGRGLYKAAIRLTRGHNISMLPIFESLTAACVNVTHEKVGLWLQDNNLADLAHRQNPADIAWDLLQKLVVENELSDSTLIRKSVVNKLLSLNEFIPQWLYNSYKRSSSRELLQLLVKHNRLLEAAELACEIINAMLGAGSEYFDFKHALSAKNATFSFPVNTIDVLMYGLKLNGKSNIEYERAHVQLEEEVARYVSTVKRVTDDKITLAVLQDRENQQLQNMAH